MVWIHTKTDAPSPPSAHVAALLIALLCLIWGSTWVAIKIGLRDVPIFHYAGLRMAIAAGVMLLVAGRLAHREGGARPPLWLSLFLGTANIAVSYGIIYWAENERETNLDSSLVCILWASFPLMMAVAGHFFLPGERLRPAQALGFLLGFGGILLLFRTDIAARGGSALHAAAIVLLSPLVSTAGTVVVKRHGKNVSSLLLNRDGMVIGAILLLGYALLFERGAPITWTATSILILLYLSLFGTVLAFGLYFWLMRYVPATRMSLITYVTPLVAIVLGASLGAETIGWATVLGAALILGGVALARRGERSGIVAKRPPERAAETPGDLQVQKTPL